MWKFLKIYADKKYFFKNFWMQFLRIFIEIFFGCNFWEFVSRFFLDPIFENFFRDFFENFFKIWMKFWRNFSRFFWMQFLRNFTRPDRNLVNLKFLVLFSVVFFDILIWIFWYFQVFGFWWEIFVFFRFFHDFRGTFSIKLLFVREFLQIFFNKSLSISYKDSWCKPNGNAWIFAKKSNMVVISILVFGEFINVDNSCARSC